MEQELHYGHFEPTVVRVDLIFECWTKLRPNNETSSANVWRGDLIEPVVDDIYSKLGTTLVKQIQDDIKANWQAEDVENDNAEGDQDQDNQPRSRQDKADKRKEKMLKSQVPDSELKIVE